MKIGKITIKGIVQGVGFRPFLFNLAKYHQLNGIITNKGNVGVELLIPIDNDIKERAFQKFISDIINKKPDIAYIETIDTEWVSDEDLTFDSNVDKHQFGTKLVIKPSISGIGEGLTLPPDIAVCDECIKDMWNPKLERFYKYPFIACANCGPRFTTVIDLPYDRERTTMAEFPYCHKIPWDELSRSCIEEYNDITNRRSHAQTFACTRCGPNYFFVYNKRMIKSSILKKILPEDKYEFVYRESLDSYIKSKNLVTENANKSIQAACEFIKSGKIIAVMGIGGVHLVSKATDHNIIDELRNRKKQRRFKPFAIMVKDIETARKYAYIDENEELLMVSYRRPIVLVSKKDNSDLPDNLAPGMPNIGIMLPYTGIHHLLFSELEDTPLIFTSGNASHVPMAITPTDVITQLSELADGFLLHNRLIYQRCDDSVIRSHNGSHKLIRRSRGYVPEYIPLPFSTKAQGTITVGPELNSTALVARGSRLFPTQHIGNVNNLETYNFLKNSINHMKRLLKIQDYEVDIIAYDAHPLFNSTDLARNLYEQYSLNENKKKIQFISIQHHFAHAASLMVDCMIPENEYAVIATLDGVGYGSDGKVWGGEIIMGGYTNFTRVVHLNYIPMIGGDQCVTYPARMLIGYLLKIYPLNEVGLISEKLGIIEHLNLKSNELELMLSAYSLGENTAYTSSTGRLLDAISSLLDICQLKTYRGEPAMRLEGIASQGNPHKYDFYKFISENFQEDRILEEIPQETIIKSIIDLIFKEYPIEDHISQLPFQFKADVSASALYSIGKIFGKLCCVIAKKNEVKNIGLSGGVAYNSILSEGFYSILNDTNIEITKLKILKHMNIPPGDGGISIGQAAIAIAKYNQDHK